ncbi:MAG: ParB/RepB/Spo0J family partition protein [Syntrophomonadaceae bacterium]|nr:ParB/RepB/Spo0J family partition protein [Syntrophomonadaceae bacterium]
MSKRERGLGRGLDALFSSSNTIDYDSEEIINVDINDVIPREDQPRKFFNIEALNELADSIREHGVLQPILVRAIGEKYEIIAGERRYRAAKLVDLESIPVVIKDVSDKEAMEIALIENLQREDLSVVEEALAYKGMIEEFGYIQEEIAQKVGKSRTHIANTIRILKLPDEILQMLEDKKITAGHARTLLSINDPKEQIAIAKKIAAENISVREAEQKAKTRKKMPDNKPTEIIDLEDRLQKYFGTKAEITPKRKGGSINISYYDNEDLQRILELLGIIS